MNRVKLMKELGSILPPFQPELEMRSNISSFRGKVQDWNDKNIKSFAYFFGFSTSSIAQTINLYPDNCYKIIFEYSNDEAMSRTKVAGINSEITSMDLKKNSQYFFFMPYSHLAMDLNVEPIELLNTQMDATDVLKKGSNILEYMDHVSAESDFDSKIKIITDCMDNNIKILYSPELSEFCSLAMCFSKGLCKMRDIESYTGYSERYCRQEFKHRFGVSMKRYNRIMRFQGAMRKWLESRDNDAQDIIFECGYYDQSHFIRDFKMFVNQTPTYLKHSFERI